jgi:hypothetical protein
MQEIIDPHVVIAILCLTGALMVAGALIVWLAVEAERNRK